MLRVGVQVDDRTTRDTGAQTAAQPGVIGEDTPRNRLEGIAPVAGGRRVGNFTRIFPKGRTGDALDAVWAQGRRQKGQTQQRCNSMRL